MSYSIIDISEVGPAEYPLIGVLRDAIFGEFGHHFSASVEQTLEGRQDVLALIAHLEGNPVGYKVGYREHPQRYYSWTGGVLKDYRGQGVGRRMQHWQHGWLRSRGYRWVSFNTFNKFPPMLRLGLATGFVPTGVNLRPENEMSIHLTKDLTQPDPLPRERLARAPVHIESVSANYHGMIADLATQAQLPMSEADIDRELAGPDPLALVAFAEGQPVGFTIGRGQDDRHNVYESRLTAVAPPWQDRGIGAALAQRQIESVRTSYRMIRQTCRHDQVPLLRLALAAGYHLNGMTFDDVNKVARVVLELPLTPST